MKHLAAVVAIGLSMGVAQASDWTGAYGLISKVVFEPNADKPQRMQVFGAFSMANRDDRNTYLAPEQGYLYVELPASNKDQALREWADLKASAGKGTVLGFGSRYGDSKWRVRAESEKLAAPDVYHLGTGMQLLRTDTNYAPVKAILEFAASKEVTQANAWIGAFGLISKVVFEPNAEKPERMQIWGAFTLADTTDKSGYLAPERGYIYVALPAANQAKAVEEWKHLEKVAGKGAVVGFGQRSSALKLRVRKASETLAAPDVYALGLGKQWMRGGKEYPPVTALFEFETPKKVAK